MALRIDQLLVERGLASSRSQAQRLITAGVQWRMANGPEATWNTVRKNGDQVPEQAELQLLDEAESRYVSRGGLKLEAALRETGVAVAGLRCLDVGQSTGGFTDCLLQLGAAHVVGVDVGQGQLHANLRKDPRVTCIEKVNARELSMADLIADDADADDVDVDAEPNEDPFGLIVADVSFISLTYIIPSLVPMLAPGGAMVMLVKPQFELQPGQVGKGGIVRDVALYADVEARVRQCLTDQGVAVRSWFPSAITGGDGNHEFFVYATHSPEEAA
jgi:23S rRNA (cytidine1920-2'-O)/16S rRNA (cytidine1409-2'-O)-methyltransferase